MVGIFRFRNGDTINNKINYLFKSERTTQVITPLN
jgi:hypothetical protein